MLQVSAYPSLRGQLERRTLGQRASQFELDVANRLAVAGVRVRRVVHDEGVQRVAVPGCVYLGLEDRQVGAAEEAADPREQLFLVRQIDHQLQSRAVPRQPRLDHRLLAIDPEVQLARMPGDVAGAVTLEINAVEALPEVG